MKVKELRILKDEVITLPQGIQLVGRLDRDSFRFKGKQRLPVEELMKNVDKSKPVILLDHQPYNLDQSEKNGVDLQLSGHTHNGQIWPLNYLVKMMYEVSYGYKKKGEYPNNRFVWFWFMGTPYQARQPFRGTTLINIRFSGEEK